MASTDKKIDPIQGMGPGTEDVVPSTLGSTYLGISRDQFQDAVKVPVADLGATEPDRLGPAQLDRRISELEAVIARMEPIKEPAGESICATMVGGIFNCPECGLRISSPALIATQGLKTGGYYEHPFEDSPRLSGKKCRLIGKKFESPVVTLQMITPKSVQKLDVQETIGV